MRSVNTNPDRLYELIPVVYRMRDAEQGYPLQALLRVIAEQVILVEQDIAGLYENWFIETCDDWVVPYIGDLVGHRAVHNAGEPGAGGREETSARNRILYPRADIANTVRYRRSKGTRRGLELLASAVSGWPVLAVEAYRKLGVTQNISYLRLNRGRTLDLRDADALSDIGLPFDESARGVDMRAGNGNINDVKVYAWRMSSYGVTRTPAYCYEEVAPNCFLFGALGNDTVLYTLPADAGNKSPSKLTVPMPITREMLEAFATVESQGARRGVPLFYGVDKSFVIAVGTADGIVPEEQIIAADLSAWDAHPRPGQVAIDPALGRIMFPPLQTRRQGVWVSYRYGAPTEIGGGEYARSASQPEGARVYKVGTGEESHRIADAVSLWKQEGPRHAVIEIVESGVYSEALEFNLSADTTLKLRGASGVRPVLRLLDMQVSAPDSLQVSGEAGSWFSLEGILVTGRGVQVDGEMAGIVIRHATLVPGWALHCDCEPRRPAEPSLIISGNVGCVRIANSIVGAIEVNRNQVETDPVTIKVTDSIIDATSDERIAIGTSDQLCAHAALTVFRSTIFGQVQTHAMDLAENSILNGQVLVCRRQTGCIRFCYVAPGSRTPRRFKCQPDLVEAAVRDRFARGGMTPQERDIELTTERLRVEPDYNSVRYGAATYAQLSDECAVEIRTGAEDDSEMGVFHDLFQPQRMASLQAHLDEYAPAGVNPKIFLAT
jgi:hypothetical protein